MTRSRRCVTMLIGTMVVATGAFCADESTSPVRGLTSLQVRLGVPPRTMLARMETPVREAVVAALDSLLAAARGRLRQAVCARVRAGLVGTECLAPGMAACPDGGRLGVRSTPQGVLSWTCDVHDGGGPARADHSRGRGRRTDEPDSAEPAPTPQLEPMLSSLGTLQASLEVDHGALPAQARADWTVDLGRPAPVILGVLYHIAGLSSEERASRSILAALAVRARVLSPARAETPGRADASEGPPTLDVPLPMEGAEESAGPETPWVALTARIDTAELTRSLGPANRWFPYGSYPRLVSFEAGPLQVRLVLGFDSPALAAAVDQNLALAITALRVTRSLKAGAARKGLDLALEAVRLMERQVEGADLVIAGPPPEGMAELAVTALSRLGRDLPRRPGRRTVPMPLMDSMATACAAARERLGTAVSIHGSERGFVPASPVRLVRLGYVDTWPRCPLSGPLSLDHAGRPNCPTHGSP